MPGEFKTAAEARAARAAQAKRGPGPAPAADHARRMRELTAEITRLDAEEAAK